MNKGLFQIVYIITVFAVSAFSCANAKKASTIKDVYAKDTLVFPVKANSIYTLRKNFDLKGNVYLMPEGVTIKKRNGVIMNGTLIGNKTKMEVSQPVFDKVTIKGEWNVPIICSSMFRELNYVNSLKDVIALSNPSVNNTIEIEPGNYIVSAEWNKGALQLYSNTKLILNGTVTLKANNYTECYVLLIKDAHNVTVIGQGALIGDKDEHLGSKGEWGMGIDISNSQSVVISDISISNCWGDCIYVGGNSRDVNICNCILSNARRQGVSVTSAKGVVIEDCFISDISGTLPGCGVDIETNKECVVSDVTIKNLTITRCTSGIETNGHAKNSKVTGISIENCQITDIKGGKHIVCYNTSDTEIKSCSFDNSVKRAIKLQDCERVKHSRCRTL